MDFKIWNQRAFFIAMIGCIQSLIFTTIAMLFYPGGTFNDPSTIGYSFWSNLFSDLGRTVAHSGDSNLISSLIYNSSLFVMGVLLIPYFVGMLLHFKERKDGKGFIIAGSIIGIPIAISFIGASLTPADLFYSIHVTFGFFAFGTTLPLVILYTFGIFQNKGYPNRYGYVYIALGVMLFIFVLLMAFSFSEEGVMAVFAAGQNIIVYGLTGCFLFQAYGAWMELKNIKIDNI